MFFCDKLNLLVRIYDLQLWLLSISSTWILGLKEENQVKALQERILFDQKSGFFVQWIFQIVLKLHRVLAALAVYLHMIKSI